MLVLRAQEMRFIVENVWVSTGCLNRPGSRRLCQRLEAGIDAVLAG